MFPKRASTAIISPISTDTNFGFWVTNRHIHLLSERKEGIFFLDIPSHRTSPLIGLIVEPTIVPPIRKRRAVAIEDLDRQQYEKKHVGTTQTTKQGARRTPPSPLFCVV